MAGRTYLDDNLPFFSQTVGEQDELEIQEETRHAFSVKEAKKHGWQQVDFDQLRARPDGHIVNVKSGRVYVEIQHAPLLAERPQDEDVAIFAIAGRNDLRFFRLPDGSIRTEADLERRERERAQADADQALHDREQRARGPQRQLLLSDLDRDGEPLPTLRGAAEAILNCGGRIERDRHGRLTISIPDPVSAVAWGMQIGERERRHELARAANVLAHAEPLVLDALRNDRRPLPEQLADKQISITGTIVG